MPIDFVEEQESIPARNTIDFQEEAPPIDFQEETGGASPPIVPSLIQKPAGSPEELSARNFAQQLSSREHSSFWDNLTRPIEPVASWVVGMGAQDVAMRLLPESVKQTTAGTIATGTQKAVDEAIKSFVSPLGIATLGVGALPKALQAAISAGFATHMATTMPEQTKLAVQAIKEGDTEKAAQYIAGTAITGTLVGLAGKHAVQSGKAAFTEGKTVEIAAQEVGPATAAAVGVEPAKPAETPVVPPAEPIVPRETILEPPKLEVETPKPPEPAPVGMGAATPAEFELKPQNATGIKNATVDAERAKMGLPPAMEPARQEFGMVWDEAMAKIDADSGYTNRLLDELRKDPRPARPIENAVLTHRQVELQNEYTKAMRDLAQAVDDGRLEDAASERVRADVLREQLWEFYDITKKVGTEQGRGLNIRKLMVFEDFTLAKMELEKRAAKGGEKLTDAERAEVVRANADIERTAKALEEHTAGAEERVRQRETDVALREAQKSKPPTESLEDLTGKLKDKFMAGEVEAITSLIQKLARYFVGQGVKERNALLDAVHGVVKNIDPTLTMRDTMDAISGYGRFRRLSKDEISVQLRDLKGQMQQVAKLEDMEAKIPPRKTGTERRTPSDEERRLIKLVNEAKNKFQIPITDEATQLKSSLDTLKTRLRNQITDLERRIKEKDFEKKPRRFIQMDEAAQKLHFEASKAKARWMEALMKDRLARRSIPQKIIGGVAEVLNTTRAILTSFDLSAVLRQGGFITLGHPIRALNSFPAMFRAMKSEAAQHAINQEIMARKNYPLYQQSKLYLAEHGHKLSAMEEAYMSRWADKIPLVAGSQRAYVTFLNKLRADSFDAMAKSVARDAELTPVEAKAIANFINVATGRGSLGMFENAATGMATVFFAPRYVASRFQLLAGQPLYRGNARTRVLIAKEYARYLTGVALVYALGQMAGGEVESDPRSSDFGKLRFGDTRLDPLSGLQQVTVLTSRIGTGETKTLRGEVVPIVGPDVPYGKDDAFGVGARFLRTKLAPIPSAVINLRTGEDVTGKETTIDSAARDLMVPLALQDILKAMEEQGVPRGTALAILSIFGMGLQTYDE